MEMSLSACEETWSLTLPRLQQHEPPEMDADGQPDDEPAPYWTDVRRGRPDNELEGDVNSDGDDAHDYWYDVVHRRRVDDEMYKWEEDLEDLDRQRVEDDKAYFDEYFMSFSPTRACQLCKSSVLINEDVRARKSMPFPVIPARSEGDSNAMLCSNTDQTLPPLRGKPKATL